MMPIKESNCTECNRHWQELAAAATAYVKVLRHKKSAARPILNNSSEIDRELNDAAERRKVARQALKRHDASHVTGARQGGTVAQQDQQRQTVYVTRTARSIIATDAGTSQRARVRSASRLRMAKGSRSVTRPSRKEREWGLQPQAAHVREV